MSISRTRHNNIRLGSLTFRYLGALAKNIEWFFEDPIQRDAFIDTFAPRHTMAFVVHKWVDRPPHTKYYSWVTNDSGILVVHMYEQYLSQEVDMVGKWTLSEACSGPESPLNVEMRKNINDTKPVALKHLKTIYDLTGIDFEYEVDWTQVAVGTAKSGYGSKEKIGQIIHGTYLGSFAAYLEKFVQDPVYKAAFAELCGERKVLAFKIHQEDRSQFEYNWMTFEDGVLIINVGQYWYGRYEELVGRNLEKAFSSVGGLSLGCRKNINDFLPARDKNLSIIETATGIAFEVDVDWELMNRQVKGREDKAGEVVYSWYLGGLAKRIAKACENPVMKDAIVDCFGSRRTIGFHIHANAPEEHRNHMVWTTNEDGILTINFEDREAADNWGEMCGNDLEKSCSQGEICLEARLDIYNTTPARNKILERILQATGVAYEVEVDWKIWKTASDGRFRDRPGTALNKYFDAFATNLAKMCEDELCKDAFVEATTAKQIHFRILPQSEIGRPINTDCTCTVSDDGILCINASVDTCGFYIDGCGRDLIKNL